MNKIGRYIGYSIDRTLGVNPRTQRYNAATIPDVPTGLTSAWIDDFARLTVDTIPADVEIEWDESEDGVTYSLVTTTGLGVLTYDNYTWQNQLMYFRARAKRGDLYSDYCDAISLQTPLVWKTNQSTLTQVVINSMIITAAKTVVIEWEDGVTENLTGTNTNKTHDYGTTGIKYIKLSGDVNWITSLSHISQVKSFGDLTKWVMPSRVGSTSASVLYLYGCAFTGNPLSRPNCLAGFTNATCYLNISDNQFSGVPAFTSIPAGIKRFSIATNQFSGDLSGVSLLRTAATFDYVYINNNQFTDLPRGEHKRISTGGNAFTATSNIVNTAQLDAWFAYLNTYFATTTPVQSCTWSVAGATMGIPTGGALNTDIVGIKEKFVAAGFVATITIRTS